MVQVENRIVCSKCGSTKTEIKYQAVVCANCGVLLYKYQI